MAQIRKDEKVLAAAGGFTGLWAVTWLGTTVMAAGSVAQGAFAVGGVMSASGLTALWWKTQSLKRYHESDDEDEEKDPRLARSHRT